ncbi:MAG: YbaB/EbfC family nucleoid-associated protein [Bacilli bacterium]|nr:YbaB/EbfC family nucleoid-associated protein [Bacilli bacterium]
MNMNIQNLMREAQKMQKDLEKTQKELENTEYEGVSSFVTVVLNGNKEMKSLKIDFEDTLEGKDDMEMLEDLIVVAYNEASKKVDADKNKKLGKYGNGLSGLM